MMILTNCNQRMVLIGLAITHFLFQANAQERTLLGSFRTRAHQVRGDVYLLSEKVLEIENFNYDGTAPAAFFWADTSARPSRQGRVIPDGTPSNNCALTPFDTDLPRLTNVVQRVEFPDGLTIRDFLGGSLSVWCEAFAANFGDMVFPETLLESQIPSAGPPLQCGTGPTEPPEPEVPSIAQTPEGYNCEPMTDDFQVRWRIDGNDIDIELVGDIQDDVYMAFGPSGSTTATLMDGADVVIADIPTSSGQARARDYYMDTRAQCSGVAGVCADTISGDFTNDVSNVSGEKDFGLTLVRYRRPLVPSDAGSTSSRGELIDQSISSQAGTNTFIAWALGPISPTTGNPNFHNIGYARQDGFDVFLDFGREVADNCVPLVTIGATSAPTATPPPPFRRPFVGDDETVIDAHIGPSGGPRGYSAITGGLVSWGIAWYLNGYLIPEMVMRRGTTYTFRVNGGDDPNDDANYHPFYITTSAFGGYFQLTPEERLNETPLAGITITETDPITGGVTGFDVEGLAPICRYETTAATTPEVELGSYEDYFDTLDTSCARDTLLTAQAGIIEFTPDESTPDFIYYHCVTHFNLGFMIRVIDADAPEATQMPTAAPTGRPDFNGFEELALQGQLEGSTLRSKFNREDSRAGGQDTIDIVFDAPTSGWVGFALNDNGGFMIGSEAIIGLPDTGEVQKYFLSSQSVAGVQPMPEANQTLIDASITQDSGRTVLRFTKILIEPGEIPINIEADNTFLGAWGFSNSLGIHSNRDTFTFSGQLIVTREQGLWKAHGWLAALAWSLFCPLAIASSVLRSLFPDEGLWFQLHRGLNMMVVTFTIAAFAIAVAAINSETPSGADPSHFDRDFSNGHRLIGLFIFILAFIQALGGILRPHLPHKPPAKDEEDQQREGPPPEKSTLRILWEGGHKGLGIGLLSICWYQVQLGISSYHDIFNSDESAALATFWALAGTFGVIIVLGYVMKFTS